MYSNDVRVTGSSYSALIQFCQVVDLEQQAFHPSFFRQILNQRRRSRNSKERRRLFKSPGAVESWLEESYQQAMEKHIRSGSTWPQPKRIGFSYFLTTDQFVLSWYTRRGTEIHLVVQGNIFSHQSYFCIKGWDRMDVMKYTGRARMNTDISFGDVLDFIQKYQQWK